RFHCVAHWTRARSPGNDYFNASALHSVHASPGDIERDLLKTWSRAFINENIPAASVHVVEQPDVRNTIVDLVIRRVRWRRRIRQSLLPVQERQDRSDAWFRSPLGHL